MVKAVFVINDFLIGGAQKLLADVLTRIDRTRIDPSLVTLFDLGDSRATLYEALPAGLRVERFRFSGFRDLASWLSLLRYLRRERPDVVVANLYFSNTVMRLLAPLAGYRTLIVEHNTYTHKTQLQQWTDRVLAHATYRIIAVSRTVADFTVRQERIPAERFIVIHNGLDLARIKEEARNADVPAVRRELDAEPDARLIMNVARVVPQKNHRALLEGFKDFATGKSGYLLVIVGGGKDLEVMREYARSLGIHDRVRFLGYRKDVPRLLAAAEFFVSTSLIEGFGIAHAEALAAGVPVLTTKTAGPDELIQEGVNGLFLEGTTAEAVASGLRKMSEQDLEAMRTRAAASVETYSIERTVAAYEALIEAAARVRARPR